MTTYCDDCDFVAENTRKKKWYRWQCLKHPRAEGFGFVTQDIRESEPYLLCKDVNGGACPLYSRRRKDGQTEMKLKEKE